MFNLLARFIIRVAHNKNVPFHWDSCFLFS
nr:MAG TPA_asm: hypothetical protein [Caudoviricetes sp.]